MVKQWKQNPYYQYFCGYNEFQIVEPCHPTELVYFRKRIGKDGMQVIFGESIALHGKSAQEKKVIVEVEFKRKISHTQQMGNLQ